MLASILLFTNTVSVLGDDMHSSSVSSNEDPLDWTMVVPIAETSCKAWFIVNGSAGSADSSAVLGRLMLLVVVPGPDPSCFDLRRAPLPPLVAS
ncbi:hypothetical protein RRF57_012991 [Xylaria bambusicola]|uniref:Secreted protein n=1 Tax=Xylaria bambusicola TaxID=326684 RepID=A0AAN7Z4Z6_9PEZI